MEEKNVSIKEIVVLCCDGIVAYQYHLLTHKNKQSILIQGDGQCAWTQGEDWPQDVGRAWKIE